MAAVHVLPFEKPYRALEDQVARLQRLKSAPAMRSDIERLQERALRLRERAFAKLTRWQTVQLSRHPQRPQALDYVSRLFTDFVELHGDRLYSDDEAIVGGLARLDRFRVVVLGQQKGRGAKEKVRRNFGSAHPEGYRKALRLMRLAERFGLPVVVFIDTQGAYPGIGAEERGQSRAIAENLEAMATLRVPLVATVIGEGGSGGALALAVADRVNILQYAVYSVISPEGCASILWKDPAKAERAADELKVTAPDLLKLGVVDEVIPEPPGGAHRDHDGAARLLGEVVVRQLGDLSAMDPDRRTALRQARFRAMGAWEEGPVPLVAG
jgi:acetyl-CoA carboxylase carboxyl transferase subunit alpha